MGASTEGANSESVSSGDMGREFEVAEEVQVEVEEVKVEVEKVQVEVEGVQVEVEEVQVGVKE